MFIYVSQSHIMPRKSDMMLKGPGKIMLFHRSVTIRSSDFTNQTLRMSDSSGNKFCFVSWITFPHYNIFTRLWMCYCS